MHANTKLYQHGWQVADQGLKAKILTPTSPAPMDLVVAPQISGFEDRMLLAKLAPKENASC